MTGDRKQAGHQARRQAVPRIRVTRWGGVEIGEGAVRGPLTIEDLEEALEISAELVAGFGEVMLPLFERCERELEAARTRSSAVERARRIAEAARERAGPE